MASNNTNITCSQLFLIVLGNVPRNPRLVDGVKGHNMDIECLWVGALLVNCVDDMKKLIY